MPNPTDTLYAPPLPPLGKTNWDFPPPKASAPSSPLYFDDVVAKQPAVFAKFDTLQKARTIVRTINEDEARGQLLKTIVAHPRRVNPRRGDGGCLNTSLTSPSHHCVAAQVVVDLGLPLPATNCDDNNGGFATLAQWLRKNHGVDFSPKACDLLQIAQSAADGDSTSTDPDGWLVAVSRAVVRPRY